MRGNSIEGEAIRDADSEGVMRCVGVWVHGAGCAP